MSYKDRDVASRRADSTFWEWSERKFEEHTSWQFMSAGSGMDTDDTPIPHYLLPLTLRHQPDYIARQYNSRDVFYVEVQGTGKGGNNEFKFKQQKLDELRFWNKLMQVWFWLWDEATEEYYIISFNKIQLLIAQGAGRKDSFDDGKRPFWGLRASLIAEQQDWMGER